MKIFKCYKSTFIDFGQSAAVRIAEWVLNHTHTRIGRLAGLTTLMTMTARTTVHPAWVDLWDLSGSAGEDKTNRAGADTKINNISCILHAIIKIQQMNHHVPMWPYERPCVTSHRPSWGSKWDKSKLTAGAEGNAQVITKVQLKKNVDTL